MSWSFRSVTGVTRLPLGLVVVYLFQLTLSVFAVASRICRLALPAASASKAVECRRGRLYVLEGGTSSELRPLVTSPRSIVNTASSISLERDRSD